MAIVFFEGFDEVKPIPPGNMKVGIASAPTLLPFSFDKVPEKIVRLRTRYDKPEEISATTPLPIKWD